MYVCIYNHVQRTYIHIHIHTYVYKSMHTCIHTCIHAYLHAYMHTYRPTYMHTFLYTHIHTCMHIPIHRSIFLWVERGAICRNWCFKYLGRAVGWIHFLIDSFWWSSDHVEWFHFRWTLLSSLPIQLLVPYNTGWGLEEGMCCIRNPSNIHQ